MRLSNIRVLLFPVIVAGFIILMHSVTAAQEDAPPQPPTELEEEQAAPPPGLSELVLAIFLIYLYSYLQLMTPNLFILSSWHVM